MIFIGWAEVADALGVVLPAATGVLPCLAPLAATGQALKLVLTSVFSARRREFATIALNLVLMLLALFVWYGHLDLAAGV